jgi:TetR/AcrR family transcriptional regulator, copper-responsive repressor
MTVRLHARVHSLYFYAATNIIINDYFRSRTEMDRRPRGRPRAFDPDEVLERALELLWTDGFEATSLDHLAAATRVARPSLAAAFGDKEAIYVKALERFSLRMGQLFQRAFGAERPLRDALRQFYFKSLDVYFSGQSGPRGCLAFCTAPTPATGHPAIQAALAAMIAELDAAFEGVFRAARGRGELSASADAKLMATLASATLQSIAIRARAGQDRNSLERLAKDAVQAICGKDEST